MTGLPCKREQRQYIRDWTTRAVRLVWIEVRQTILQVLRKSRSMRDENVRLWALQVTTGITFVITMSLPRRRAQHCCEAKARVDRDDGLFAGYLLGMHPPGENSAEVEPYILHTRRSRQSDITRVWEEAFCVRKRLQLCSEMVQQVEASKNVGILIIHSNGRPKCSYDPMIQSRIQQAALEIRRVMKMDNTRKRYEDLLMTVHRT